MITQEHLDLLTADAAQRYGVASSDITFLGGFLNRVYEYEREGKQYILRISAESQRTVEIVAAEIDWLRFLIERGLSVAQPVPSLAGNWVEVSEIAEKKVPIVVFEKALGQPPSNEDWNEELFRNMGRFLGKMHQLTRDYTPRNTTYKRPTWREDLDAFAASYLPAVDEAIQAKYREIRNYPEHLPQPRDAYGLVHTDFHRGNFFVHQGKLTLFDFDDSQYSWFSEDLAMALFYAIWPGDQTAERQQQLAQTFYDTLLEGYQQENHLEERWLKEIPHFLKQREICLYMILTSQGESQWNETIKQFMEGRREKILNNVPYVDIALTQ